MTNILNFALKIKGGGREGGTCEVLRPCHPLKIWNLHLLYSRLSLRFSLMRSRMAWLIGDLGSLRLYTSGVDVSTALMSLSHKVTASSSSLSCVVMFCVYVGQAVFQYVVW